MIYHDFSAYNKPIMILTFSKLHLVSPCYIGHIHGMITLTNEVVQYVKAPTAKDVFVVCLSVCIFHMMLQHVGFLWQYVPRLTKH